MSETLFSIDDDRFDVGQDLDNNVHMMPSDGPTTELAADSFVEQPVTFDFVGENRKNYLFVTDDPRVDYMSDTGMDAFLKTLAARKMSLVDVAVFNLSRHKGAITFAMLIAFFKPKAVVLLGASAVDVGLQEIDVNSIGNMGDIRVFQSYSFDVLLSDGGKKSAFWPVLKSILL